MLYRLYMQLFGVVFLTISAFALEIDLTIDVEAGSRECFYQNIKPDIDVNIEYQVIDGGEMDINFVIQSPSGRVLLSELRKMEGLHTVKTTEDGDYAFCLDNTFSRFSNKVVFFELLSDTEEEEQTYKAAPDENIYDIKLEDFKKSLDDMLEHLKRTTQIQNVLRAVESRDRSIQEYNFERVNFWSGIQIFVMMSVALTNVLMIRGLFTDSSKNRPTKMRT